MDRAHASVALVLREATAADRAVEEVGVAKANAVTELVRGDVRGDADAILAGQVRTDRKLSIGVAIGWEAGNAAAAAVELGVNGGVATIEVTLVTIEVTNADHREL